MNEDIKTKLDNQAQSVFIAAKRAETTKAALDLFDANSRISAKADGQKRTEADTDAMVTVAPGRAPLLEAALLCKADYESMKVDTQCLLAKVSLICSETAAMSRIAQ